MHPEIDAEVVLISGEDKPASVVDSFGFIVTFGHESFSAAVVPSGSGTLKRGQPSRVRLRFLVEEAAPHLEAGAPFTFFEGGRSGKGALIGSAV